MTPRVAPARSATLQRCPWCGDDPLYVEYHDREWGVPSRDERHLLEMLCLEGQQAGLSWITVLRKRERYRERFHGFEASRVARMTARDIDRALADPGLIRHPGKLTAIRDNARAAEALGPLAPVLWAFVDDAPRQNRPRTLADIPPTTPQSDAMSKALKRAGFRFVGPTTCYAFMQAVGMVNDHLLSCPRHDVVAGMTRR